MCWRAFLGWCVYVGTCTFVCGCMCVCVCVWVCMCAHLKALACFAVSAEKAASFLNKDKSFKWSHSNVPAGKFSQTKACLTLQSKPTLTYVTQLGGEIREIAAWIWLTTATSNLIAPYFILSYTIVSYCIVFSYGATTGVVQQKADWEVSTLESLKKFRQHQLHLRFISF